MRQRSSAQFLVVSAILMGLGMAACGGRSGGDATAVPTPSGAITIDPPTDEVLRVPFTVSGTANVFEGRLIVQAIDAAGEIVCQHRVQATSGSGTPGTWEAVLAFLPPAAEQEITIKAFSGSAKDGSEENVVSLVASLSPELPAIVIESPACGGLQSTVFILDVSGTASVFEAALIVELRQLDGTVLQTKSLTASAAGPERGTWQVSLDVSALPPGFYEVVAYSISAKDGTAENIFSVPIRRNA